MMETENNTAQKKRRPNLLDICFAAVVLIAAFLVLRQSGGTGGIVTPDPLQKVVYTVEIEEMRGDSAHMIKPGDILLDRIERRHMGTVIDVDVQPTRKLENDLVTGGRVVSVVPGRYNAVITVEAEAIITDRQITVEGGFVVRAGLWITVNGPLYGGTGFITDIVRSDAA